ncbi:MAG: DUF58 domain-containing protein, partial [Sandaracinaceae bacterium]|nr:DUF58 domain-containing protein [Sandaracinaceae bacterium]
MMKHTIFDAHDLRRLEGLRLVLKRSAESHYRGERPSRKAGSGIELFDYREYSPGDEFRSIDPLVYARTGRLMVRLFREESDLAVHIFLDISRSMQTALGTSDPLLWSKRLVAALAYIALSGLDRVSVGIFHAQHFRALPLRREKGAFASLLRFLEEAQPKEPDAPGKTDILGFARNWLASAPTRGLLIVVSDLYDPQGVEKAFDLLRRHHLEVAVVQPYETSIAKHLARLGPDLHLLDSESGEVLSLEALSDADFERIDEAFAQYRRKLEAWFRSRNIR